jgi:hypothetical protein
MHWDWLTFLIGYFAGCGAVVLVDWLSARLGGWLDRHLEAEIRTPKIIVSKTNPS